GGAGGGGGGEEWGCCGGGGGVGGWIRDRAPDRRPCLEAQVMDWADDVAYSVHDLEDGLHSGLIELDRLRDPEEVRQVAILTQGQYCAQGTVTVEELCEIFGHLTELSYWPRRFNGEPETAAAVSTLTREGS